MAILSKLLYLQEKIQSFPCNSYVRTKYSLQKQRLSQFCKHIMLHYACGLEEQFSWGFKASDGKFQTYKSTPRISSLEDVCSKGLVLT